MKISTGPGHIFLQLVSDSWSTNNEAAAVAEITERGASTSKPKRTVPIGVNEQPVKIPLDAGEYTVRMYLPSGDVLAQSVRVGGNPDDLGHVGFDLPHSPREWLSFESALGAVQRLPDRARANALQAWRDTGESESSIERNRRGDRLTQAAKDYISGLASLDRISFGLFDPMSGRCQFSKVDLNRPLPEGRLSTKELIYWWTGAHGSDKASPLVPTIGDDRNMKFAATGSVENSFDFLSGERRAFATVADPASRSHFAVFPVGWVRTSRNSPGTPAEANVLMTAVIESIMRANDASEDAARWRCVPAVSDVEAMTYLGFLYSGQANAAEAMLDLATDFVYDKTLNPVAAAAGAFGLLAFKPPESGSRRASWQQWIRNLYTMFPRLPDGAIAMAQLYLRFGEGRSADEEIDVEILRGYVLDAVRRGLPYLSYGIRPLSEMLLMLVSDDQEHDRVGHPVEETRRARRMVQQLERLVSPGAFFTVLTTREETL